MSAAIPLPGEIKLLACDYDRTLTTTDLRLLPDTVAALSEARKLGLKVVVVSGRDLAFLREHMGPYVDALVAENGCYLQMNGSDGPVCLAPSSPPLRQLLADAGLDLEFGETLASAAVEDEAHLRRALGDHAGKLDFIRNRDRVMLLPKGVDKAAGFLLALKRLGVPARHAAAAGDGENDLPLLRVAGYRIAVSNAVPEIKAEAHFVTAEPGGAGIAAWIRDQWLPGIR